MLAEGKSEIGHDHLAIECPIQEHRGDRISRGQVSDDFTELAMRATQVVLMLCPFP